MNPNKRAALEAAGYQVGNVEDLLELTPEEKRLVELRLALARTVRRLREEQQLTERQLAARLNATPASITRLEAAEADIPLDPMFRALFLLGGRLVDVVHSSTIENGEE